MARSPLPRLALSALFFAFASLTWLAPAPADAQVAPVNQPPVITAPSEIARDPGQGMAFNVSTSDPDGNRVILEGADVPPGALWRLDGHGNGFFQWVPKPADEGIYFLQLIATDDGAPPMRTTAEVRITVGDPNLPPVLDPIGDRETFVGSTLRVPLAAVDPEGDPLDFSVDPPLGFIEPGATSAEATWVYQPARDAVGIQELTFTVRDATGSDAETILVSVGDVNLPPLLEPIGDRQVEAGAALMIVLMASDPDGDALAFDAVGLPDGVALFDAGDGTGRIEGMPATAGVFRVTVGVTDDGMPLPERAEETFAIEVLAPLPQPAPVPVSASWERGMLRLEGEGAEPGTPVVVLDPMTGAFLGEAVADADGRFQLEVRPYVPPCSIQVAVGDVVSEPLAVDGAPKGCGQARAVRSHARWHCSKGLYVKGVGAPPGGTVRIHDAESDELLAVTRASGRWGFFRVRAPVDAAPAAVRVTVEDGGIEWSSGPFEVRTPKRCARPDDDRADKRRCEDDERDKRWKNKKHEHDDKRWKKKHERDEKRWKKKHERDDKRWKKDERDKNRWKKSWRKRHDD